MAKKDNVSIIGLIIAIAIIFTFKGYGIMATYCTTEECWFEYHEGAYLCTTDPVSLRGTQPASGSTFDVIWDYNGICNTNYPSGIILYYDSYYQPLTGNDAYDVVPPFDCITLSEAPSNAYSYETYGCEASDAICGEWENIGCGQSGSDPVGMDASCLPTEMLRRQSCTDGQTNWYDYACISHPECAPKGATCVDSDDGITPKIAGYSEHFVGGVKMDTKTDYCLSSDILVEAVCTNNLSSVVQVFCASEYGSGWGCRDGACTLISPSEVCQQCKDSDGLNYAEKGTVTCSNEVGPFEDSCVDENFVREYICWQGNYLEQIKDCRDYGEKFACLDGVCVGDQTIVCDEWSKCRFENRCSLVGKEYCLDPNDPNINRTCTRTSEDIPSDCRIIEGCGNGQIDAGEECDDGNNINGDGCSADCKIESFPAVNIWYILAGIGIVVVIVIVMSVPPKRQRRRF